MSTLIKMFWQIRQALRVDDPLFEGPFVELWAVNFRHLEDLLGFLQALHVNLLSVLEDRYGNVLAFEHAGHGHD